MKSHTTREEPENFMSWIILISRSRRSAYSARSCLRAPFACMGFEKRHVFEVGVGGVGGVFGRDIEAREWVHHFFKSDLAALGDLPGAVDGILQLAEELHHLLASLQVEIRRARTQDFADQV